MVICRLPREETQCVNIDLATSDSGLLRLSVSRSAYPFAFPPVVLLRTILIRQPLLLLPPAKTLPATLTRQSSSLLPPYLAKARVSLLPARPRLFPSREQVLVTSRTLLHLTLPRITPIQRFVLLVLTQAMYGLLLLVIVVTPARTGVISLQVLPRLLGTTEGFPSVFLLLLEILALTKPKFLVESLWP